MSNVKPGDLAISVGGERREHIGAIVQVVRPYTGPQRWTSHADWVIEYRGEEYAAEDRFLRPLRGDPGEDQSLSWKCGRPSLAKSIATGNFQIKERA